MSDNVNAVVIVPIFTHLRYPEDDFACGALVESIYSTDDPHDVTCPECKGMIEQSEPRHADYPHEPGALHDCPVCEKNCFCLELNKGQCGRGGGEPCVHCALVMNPNEPETCDGSGDCPQDAHYMISVWTAGGHRFMGTSNPYESQCLTCGAVYREVRSIALPEDPDSTVEPGFVWEYQGGDGKAVQQCSGDTGRAHGYERVCQSQGCPGAETGEPCQHIEHDCNGVCCY